MDFIRGGQASRETLNEGLRAPDQIDEAPTLISQFWFDPELRLLAFSVLAVAVIGALMAAD